MNRAERRRQHRATRKQPVIMAGDGIVAASLGEHFEARDAAHLPAKQPGEHRWIAIASYVLDLPGTVIGSDLPKVLGPHNMMYLGVGCYDCERPWAAVPGQCPVEVQP